MNLRTRVTLFVCAALLCSAAAAFAQPADVVTLGTPTRISALTYDVPVYIRDVSGTPLGIDQPPGSRIQAYSIKVNYAPALAIQSVTFSRAGITLPLTPTFESVPASAGAISLLDTFQESTNLIPFTLDAAAPGNQVGHLVLTFNAGTAPGTVVTLTVDPTLTQLTDQGGVTKETVTLGTLTLVSSSVVMPGDIPTFDVRVLALLAALLLVIGIRACTW